MEKRIDKKEREQAEALMLKKMKILFREGKSREALDVINAMDVSRIKAASTLCLIGEVYMQENMYDQAEEFFVRAYDKSPSNRRILTLLTDLYIEMGDYSEAEYYYKEFIGAASRDLNRYTLRYRLDKAKGERIAVLIDTLERLKDYEYSERWGYELAELYHKSGDDKKALKECEEIILWFGHGVYVNKTILLKCEITGEEPPELDPEPDMDIEHMADEAVEISGTGIDVDLIARALEQQAGTEAPDTSAMDTANNIALWDEASADADEAEIEATAQPAMEIPNTPNASIFDALSTDTVMDFWSGDGEQEAAPVVDDGLKGEAFTGLEEDTDNVDDVEDFEDIESMDEDFLEEDFEEDFEEDSEDDFEDEPIDQPEDDFLANILDEEDDDEDDDFAQLIHGDEDEDVDQLFSQMGEMSDLGEEDLDEEDLDEENLDEDQIIDSDNDLFEDELLDEDDEDDLDEVIMDDDVEDERDWTEDDKTFISGLFDESKTSNSLFATVPNIDYVKEQLNQTFTKFEDAETANFDILADYDINFVVLSNDPSMKAQIALGIAKALNTYGKCDKNKIVRATAEDLNQRDFSVIFDKLSDGCLVIEGAGKLSDESAKIIETYVNSDNQTTAIILESTKDEIMDFWKRHQTMRSKFLNVINVSKYNEMELVTLAKGYIESRKYELDPDAALILRDQFSKAIEEGQVINYEDVIDVVDQAISKLEKRNVKNLFMTVLDNKYEEAKMFRLLPEDFEN